MRFVHFYFNPNGRIGRRAYWLYGVLPIQLSSWIGATIQQPIQQDAWPPPIWVIVLFPIVIWASLALEIKRVHDRDHSFGWLFLVGLIPVVGPIWVFIDTCRAGTDGPNRFGDSPDGRPEAQVGAL
jgi:uncharacterized membrane protein YhaH (DUF805 family)